MTNAEFQKYLHEHIPITEAMGVSVKKLDDKGIVLQAPIDKNINHRDSAFGGSICSLLVMSSWSQLYHLLKKHGIQGTIVAQKCEVSFIRPILVDFETTNTDISIKEEQKFIDMLKKFKKSRIKMRSSIQKDGEKLATFEGIFVVIGSR